MVSFENYEDSPDYKRKNDNKRKRPPQYFIRKNGKKVFENDLDGYSYDELNDLHHEIETTLNSMTEQRDSVGDSEPEWFHPLKVKIRCASSFMEVLKELIDAPCSKGDEPLSHYFMQIAKEELQSSEYDFFVKEAESRQKGEASSV